MVAITGSDISSAEFRAGRYGHIRWVHWSNEALGHGRAWVPNDPRHAVRAYPGTVRAWRVRDGRYTRLQWTYGAGRNSYAEWDDLIRFGQDYAWRVVRYTGSP
jgi:predicted oxidoreductase